MTPRSPQIGVQIVGRRFIRFVIGDDQGQYWTGGGWSPDRSHALLYADLDLVRADLKKLKKNRRKSP